MQHIANITSPPEEGLVEEKDLPSQATEPTSQETEQPQETGKESAEQPAETPVEQPKVENPESKTSSTEEKPRPSNFVYQRKELRRLKDTVSTLTEELERLKQQKAETPLPKPAIQNTEEFLQKLQVDPAGALSEVLSPMLGNAVQTTVKRAFDEQTQAQKQQEFVKQKQEAQKLILSSKHAKGDEEQVAQFEQDLQEIANRYGLDYFASVNPVEATKALLDLHEKEHPTLQKPHANSAPTKGQLRSAATGGVPNTNTANQGLLTAEQLMKQAQSQPHLFHDPEWTKKWETALGNK